MKKILSFCICIWTTVMLSTQSSRPIVSNIACSVSHDNTCIIITWQMQPDTIALAQNILIYRSVDTAIKNSNINTAEPIAVLTPDEKQYKDLVKDYKNYFYAVLVRQKDGSIYDILIPAVNASVRAYGLALAEKTSSLQESAANITSNISTIPPQGSLDMPMRTRPLPYLQILPPEKSEPPLQLKAETLNKTSRLEAAKTAEVPAKPDIFLQETKDSETVGDDYTLFSIVDAFFPRSDWKSAEIQLREFLQINRSEETTTRATFYLGQTLYFNGKYRQALACFQATEKQYPAWSKKWIEKILDIYRID